MSRERAKRPSSLGDVLAGVLKDAGLAERIDQAGVIPEWPSLVGADSCRCLVTRG